MHSTPDLQMDRAAQSSSSYKISLAWRYNSFSLYVSCQINLASLQTILALAAQLRQKTTKSRASPESTFSYTFGPKRCRYVMTL